MSNPMKWGVVLAFALGLSGCSDGESKTTPVKTSAVKTEPAKPQATGEPNTQNVNAGMPSEGKSVAPVSKTEE